MKRRDLLALYAPVDGLSVEQVRTRSYVFVKSVAGTVQPAPGKLGAEGRGFVVFCDPDAAIGEDSAFGYGGALYRVGALAVWKKHVRVALVRVEGG